jgi:hypothetical protein
MSVTSLSYSSTLSTNRHANPYPYIHTHHKHTVKKKHRDVAKYLTQQESKQQSSAFYNAGGKKRFDQLRAEGKEVHEIDKIMGDEAKAASKLCVYICVCLCL